MNRLLVFVDSFHLGFLILLAAGVPGIVALALLVVFRPSALSLPQPPPGRSKGRIAAQVAMFPVILLVTATLLGGVAAPVAGFHSYLFEGIAVADSGELVSEADIAVTAGAGIGIVIVSIEYTLRSRTGLQVINAEKQDSIVTLPLRFLYAGITEEILVRWGVMSVVAVGLWWLLGGDGTISSNIIILSITIAALVFAVAHLPMAMAAATYESTRMVALWVICSNSACGVVYGWLFWQFSLESAMAGHMMTHVVFVALAALENRWGHSHGPRG